MGLLYEIVESIKKNTFVKKLVAGHKRYVELIVVFKSRVVIFYVVATIGLLIRGIYFYNFFPEDWQFRLLYSVIYTYLSVSFGLLGYYYLVVLGYWDNVIKAFFGRLVNIQRIRLNRERRKAYAPLFNQKLRDAGLKDPSILSLLLLTAWVGPLSVTIFAGPLSYLFVLWYIWFCWLQFYRAYLVFNFIAHNPAPPEYQHVRPKPLQDWIDKPFVYAHGNKGAISEAVAKGSKLLYDSSRRVVSHVSSDPGRALILFSTSAGFIFGGIGGADYIASEISGRTTIISRTVESVLWGNYSADVETRHRAGWLRFRNIELADCVTPGTRRLNPESVENLYDSNHKLSQSSLLKSQNKELFNQLVGSYQQLLEQKDATIELQKELLEKKGKIIEIMQDSHAKDDKIKELERKLLELDNKQ